MDNLFISKNHIEMYGNSNIIDHAINDNVKNNTKILDIGCSNGTLIGELDKKVKNCHLFGIDNNEDSINIAKQKIFSKNNFISFVCDNYLKRNFKDKYDLIILKDFLYYIDVITVLIKAKELLSSNGRIIFNIPGKNNLSEIFASDYLLSRYSIEEIDEILSLVELRPILVQKEKYLLSIDSYLMFKNYLKDTGIFYKISGNKEEWNKEFDSEIEQRFNKYKYLNAEFFVYTCDNSKKHIR